MSDLGPTITTFPLGPSPPVPTRAYLPTVTSSMKWWLAILMGILFLIFAFPGTYNLVNSIWTTVGLPSLLQSPGKPTIWGLVVQAILFLLFIRILLW